MICDYTKGSWLCGYVKKKIWFNWYMPLNIYEYFASLIIHIP